MGTLLTRLKQRVFRQKRKPSDSEAGQENPYRDITLPMKVKRLMIFIGDVTATRKPLPTIGIWIICPGKNWKR
ncbi:MAG: hypothetical protein CL537_14735 [Alcanivoracaceae bacterium]|nr:hypothetical protein [Alcanivoracaceae bacterium]